MTTDNTKIVIGISEHMHSLGGSVVLTVRYVNHGKASVSFREPAKTWEVQLQVRRPSDDTTLRVAFGQIFHTDHGGIQRQVIEDAETITLGPGEEHTFDSDVGLRWPELFAPGQTLLRVTDLTHDDGPLSNEVRVNMAWDDATFPRLVTLAGDGQAPLASRRFAQQWIQRVHPSFHRTPEQDEGEPPLTAQAVAATLAWWQEHRGDPDVIARIDRLNG